MNTLAQLKAGQLAGAQRLDLSCGLTEFPPEIFELADSLEILNLTGNALSSLPDDLHRLTHLRILFCSNNAFTELPECLGQCAELSMIGFKSNQISHVPAAALPPLLRWLILTDNCIRQLPDELGERPLLQKLMLAGNQLEHLPQSLTHCHNLELIRIASNRFTQLPEWLLNLPSLTWLAYAGNPVETATVVADDPTTANIPWPELELAEVLGEGASGIIRKALWKPLAKPVAVKLYKGTITSDGSPLHEMQACIAAGLHPNLIKVEGRVVGHPDDQAALVMDLIDPSYRNLAALPSLDSCTRDIYEAGTRFSPEVALRMIRGVASVAAHLHRQGITHGDLYAHNILWNAVGDCLLGDFGAASFHATTDTLETRALQRIEVRAFGVLLGELLERIDGSIDERLVALQQICCQPDVSKRPGFQEIEALLQSIQQR
ncbi:protein kinase [Pseudomonas sp. BCA14]|uniref:protein kinase n=1 Tax=unclassified Pseudomonas TaxID=196821 RepID=UPI00106E57CB|nr:MULTISPECIES: protein kinase [unclassified Pseudomonas]TFF13779.1 protein kinase [Pseudomonas sp. JMN1]TFF15538.1 protein kinase [Pseudomonas sp. BCA17]TFF31945.1 protein kinase [Pseudomonas sp. BCA14]TFF32898.1 protein kinase [Pseudomonas sp. BCA13]